MSQAIEARRPLSLEQSLGPAVAALLTQVPAHRVAAMVVDLRGGREPDPSAEVQQPPADVDVVPGGGAYTVTAEVAREGEAWMPVVIEAGTARAVLDSRDRVQTVTLRSTTRPDAVVLDPDGSLLDTDRDNNRRAIGG